jgi:hypothetical protein
MKSGQVPTVLVLVQDTHFPYTRYLLYLCSDVQQNKNLTYGIFRPRIKIVRVIYV